MPIFKMQSKWFHDFLAIPFHSAKDCKRSRAEKND